MAFGGFQAPGSDTTSQNALSTYKPPSGGLFGLHLPKLGLGDLLNMPGQIASGIVGAVEHPSRLNMMARGAGASTLGTFARLGNALTLHQLNVSNAQIDKTVGGITGAGMGDTQKQELGQLAEGQWNKGVIPGLIGDVGAVALPFQAAHGLAALGDVGSAAEATVAGERAAQAGVLPETIANKAEMFDDANAGQRALSRVPVLNRLSSTAKDLAGGGGPLNAAARAAAKVGDLTPEAVEARTAGEVAGDLNPEAVAQRASTLRAMQQIAHPYTSLYHDVIRPITGAESAAVIAKTAPQVDSMVSEYNTANGLRPPAHVDADLKLNTQLAKQRAKWYADVESDPNAPAVQKSYTAFANDVKKQWAFLQSKGVKITLEDGQTHALGPYDSPEAMWDDIGKGELKVAAASGDYEAHPMEQMNEVIGKDSAGRDVTVSDAFRAVHDYFGHSRAQNTFGSDGEEVAYQLHKQMFSDEAQPALATETAGQNAALNFGEDNLARAAAGEPKVFADQKAAVMPDELRGDTPVTDIKPHTALDNEVGSAETEAADPLATPGIDSGRVGGPAENRLINQSKQEIPAWAKRLAAKTPEAGQLMLAKLEGHFVAHDVKAINREFQRNMEVARNQTLRSPAMTEARAAAQDLVDRNIVATPAEAERLVYGHLTQALDGQSFLAHAVAQGASPDFQAYVQRIVSGTDPIPKEAMTDELQAHLVAAADEWTKLRSDAKNVLLDSQRKGAKGLEKSIMPPEVQLSPKQVKQYRSIMKEYQRVAGMQPAVDKEADIARKAVLEKDDKITALGAKANLYTEQAHEQAQTVLAQTAPKSIATPEARATVIQTLVDHTNTDSGAMYDIADDKRVVFAKDATEADRVDPNVRVTPATGKVGTVERYAVDIATEDITHDAWLANPNAALETFMEEHAAALAHPDVKVSTTADETGVHLHLTQTTIDGRYLTMGQAHVLGTARGLPNITDMVDKDWHPATDSTSMYVAAKHVPEIMKPRSSFNVFIKAQEQALNDLTAMATADGTTPRITPDMMRGEQDMFMRFADRQTRVPTLQKFYNGIAIEARRSQTYLPATALLQTYLNMPFNIDTLHEAERYLGPEAQKAADWYYEQNAVVKRITGGRSVPIYDKATGEVRQVDAAELAFSLAAVTSKNSGPLGNAANAFSALADYVNYTEMEGWVQKFSTGIKQYMDEVEAFSKSGKRMSTDAAFTANDLYKRLALDSVGHMTDVRHDVMEVLSGRSVADFDNEYLRTRLAPEGEEGVGKATKQGLTAEAVAKRFKTNAADLTERDIMEANGSTGYAKIRSFYENLAHPETSQGVTLDRVMAELLGLNGGNWNAKGAYTDAAAKLRDLADQVSIEKYGETGHVMPHQMQALLWSYSKNMVNENDLGRLQSAVGDSLDSIDAGTWAAKNNPIRDYLTGDIKFGAAQPRGGKPAPREVTVRKLPEGKIAETPEELQAAKSTTETHFHKFAANDRAKISEQVGAAKYDRGRAQNWSAIEKEVQASLDRGDTVGAKKRLMGWLGSEGRRYGNEPQGFDIENTPAGVKSFQTDVVNRLRWAGFLPLSKAQEATRTADDFLGDAVFQKFGDGIVNGATYTKTGTGRLTMAFFKTADATTLVHEGAHVLRQFLGDDEIKTLERSFDAKVGTREFEEAWADNFTSYLNGVPSGARMAGLAPLFGHVKEALATIWEGVQGATVDRIDPNVAATIDRYLAPDEGAIGDAPPLPEFKANLVGKSSEQIAANLPARANETQAQSLRRGYLAGKAATKQAWLEDKAQRTLQTQAVVLKTRNDLATAIEENTLPKAQAMARDARRVAMRADKLAGKIDANASVSQIPPEWQPMWSGLRELQKAAVDDPQIAQMMSGIPQTFTELVSYAKEQGFDPTHISSLSEGDVRRLIDAPAKLGKRGRIGTEVEAGTRNARSSVNYRTRSLAALGAAQVDVVWERETNNYIDTIEKYVAKPYQADTPGWVAWDDQRGFLVTGQHTARPEPTLMVPEAVAKSIKVMSGDYSHPIFNAIGKSKIIHAWKALVMTWSPGHYTNVALNQAVLATTQGVGLRDYVTALVNMRTGEDGDFARASKWLEAHGKGKLPESVDVNDLRGIGARSEYAASTDGEGAGAMRELVRPNPTSVRQAAQGAEGAADTAKAVGSAAKTKFLQTQDKLNAFNASLHRLGRAAVYVAGRRQGLDDIAAMNRSYEALVDYDNLSPMERSVMTSIFPFYAFQKGLLKIMARFPVDHPVRASLAMQLASLNTTLMGTNQLPAYYQQLVHLPGTNKMITSKPIDPFQDALALGSPEGIAQSMNPVLHAVMQEAFNGSDGYVANYKIDQFGNTVPDSSASEDVTQMLQAGPEGNLLGSVAGVGSGGSGRGVLSGIANSAGAKTYTPAQIAKLVLRLQKSQTHTSGNYYQTWQKETAPKQPVSSGVQ